MLKRILIVLLSVAVISACMSSCNTAADPQTDSQPVTTVTTTTTTPTPTTVNEKAIISSKVAKLTNEDGTGEINLEMTLDEIADVLAKYNIPYEFDEFGCLNTPDGTSYYPYKFRLQETKRGLRVGDGVVKAIQLYGTPYKQGSSGCMFHTGKTSYGEIVELLLYLDNSVITNIELRVHEEFYGGAGD